jgi:hypothetical protein
MKKFVNSPEFSRPGKVREFVAENGRRMDTSDIATLLHSANKKKVRGVDEATLSDLLSIWETKQGDRLGKIPLTMIFQGLSLVTRTKDRTLAPRMLSCLANALTSCTDKFVGQNVGQCIYALRHISARQNEEELKRVLVALTVKVWASTETLSAQNIGNLLYGLQHISSESFELRAMLTALTVKVQSSREALKAQELGNALYGLQSMNSHSVEVCALLSALTPKVRDCREALNAQHIGNLFYGLQHMNSEAPEVRELLSELTAKVHDSKEQLSSQAVGNALYGLQHMNSDAPEVCALLSVLTLKIQDCTETLNAQAIGNALYGLQSLNSEAAEVRALLRVMTVKVQDSREALSSQHFGNGLYGLQSMNSEAPEVRALLRVLTEKLQASTETLNAQAIGNALYGLKNMNSEVLEVQAILSALCTKVEDGRQALGAQGISNALYGLCGLVSGSDGGKGGSAILELVVAELDRILTSPASLSTFDKRDLMRNLLLFSRLCRDNAAGESMKSRIDLLRASLPTQDGTDGGSRAEREFYKIVQRLLSSQIQPGGGFTVESNVWLDGCFEADIVITRVESDSSKSVVYNIEVDGPAHFQPTKQHLSRLRDQHLQEAFGMRIARISLLKPTGEWLDRNNYEKAVREVLQGLQLLPSA